VCAGLSFAPVHLFGGAIQVGGTLGLIVATYLVDSLNVAGALLATLTALIVSVYLVSTFTLAKLALWLAGPAAWFQRRASAWRKWRNQMHARSIERAKERAAKRRIPGKGKTRTALLPGEAAHDAPWEISGEPAPPAYASVAEPAPRPTEYAEIEEIPICPV